MTNIRHEEALDAMFVLPPELLEQFGPDDTHERCAVLLGHRDRGKFVITDVVEVANDATDTTSTFAIKAGSIKRAVRKGRGVFLGVLHTHWESTTYPSINDVQNIPRGWIGCVLHTKTRTITYYTRSGYVTEVHP